MRVILSLEYFGFNKSYIHLSRNLKIHVMGVILVWFTPICLFVESFNGRGINVSW